MSVCQLIYYIGVINLKEDNNKTMQSNAIKRIAHPKMNISFAYFYTLMSMITKEHRRCFEECSCCFYQLNERQWGPKDSSSKNKKDIK